MSDSFNNPSDDPRLSAYLFDEMEPEARALFEEELAADDQLNAALTKLRQVSSILGRAFAEESVINEIEDEAPVQPERAPRKLSARARAGRVSRFRHEIPRINTSVKNRYAAVAAASAAAVVLAGLITLQSVVDFSGGDRDQAMYVPLTTTKKGDYNESVPLAEEIAKDIAVESAVFQEQLYLVSNEVATGLADVMDSDAAGAMEPPSVISAAPKASSARYAFNNSKPEISLESAFAEMPSRAANEAPTKKKQPRVLLKSDRSIAAVSDYQSTIDFQFSRIPLHVETNDLGDLRRQMGRAKEVEISEITITGLVNAFDYSGMGELGTVKNNPFVIDLEVAQSPWNRVHYLVRLTLESREESNSEPARPDRPNYLAEDVRLEVKFNPEQIAAYRLIGYEPEVVSSDEIFSTPGETVDYGHELTMLYEVIPVGSPVSRQMRAAEDGFEIAPSSASGGQRGTELLWGHVEYALPDTEERLSLAQALTMPSEVPSWHGASRAFQWAAAVASFGMEILEDPLLTGANWELIEALARSGAGEQTEENFLEFISMIENARALE
tara:strand:+ start:111159 stop:112826 length:1668 start_codon:yes stop_codon:yes gene_type:complete